MEDFNIKKYPKDGAVVRFRPLLSMVVNRYCQFLKRVIKLRVLLEKSYDKTKKGTIKYINIVHLARFSWRVYATKIFFFFEKICG